MRRRRTTRHHRRAVALVAATLLAVSLLGSCGDGASSGAAAPTTTAPVGVESEACLVRVHGRGGTGAPPVVHDGYVELAPIANGTWDEGHVWLYDTQERFDDARGGIVAAVDAVACERVVLDGFSNGGALVANLLCRGDDLDGRLVGVVIDDPVPDEGTAGCTPPPDTRVALYWTGGLAEATAGRRCDDIGYTCAGDVLVGIDAYATSIGTEVKASPFTEHIWYRDAPETTAWLDDR